MLSFAARRVLSTIPVALVVGSLAFVLQHLIPGDPASVMLGPGASQDDIAQLTRSLGLDQPLVVQYVRWLGNVVRGDLGTSIFLQEPVWQSVVSRMEPTLVLALLSTVLSAAVGIPLGVAAAARPDSALDRAVMMVAVGGISVPYFWLALVLIALFAVELRVLPAVGYASPFSGDFGAWRYLVLPVLALGFSQSAIVARLARSTALQVLSEDYVRTARAKGVPARRVLFKHALRNILIPLITSIGTSFGILLGGAVVTETIFGIPGVGQLILQSILRRDYPLIQGALLMIAAVNVLVSLVTDLLYGFIDPRVAHEQSARGGGL